MTRNDGAVLAGQTNTIEVPFGHVVEFTTAADTNARAARYNPGVRNSLGTTQITSSRKLGPFDQLTSFRLSVDVGLVEWLVRPFDEIADAAAASWSGWADYVDGQYTEASPFQPAVGEWTAIDFDNVTVREDQLPSDLDSMFDLATSTIEGRNGDGLHITVELVGKPTTNTPTYLDTAIDIGGTVGRIYPRTLSYPRGQGVARQTSFSFAGYTLGTWEQNGGAIVFNPSAAMDIYNVRAVLTRTHKAR